MPTQPDPCAGIAVPDAVPMARYVMHRADSCLPGEGDGHGTLALSTSRNLVTSHGSEIDFVSPSGRLLQKDYPEGFDPNPIQQPTEDAAGGVTS